MPQTQHRLLQEEGPAAQTWGGGFAPLQLLFALQYKQHETSVSWWMGQFVQIACFAVFFKWAWLSFFEACPHFHTLPVVRGQQRQTVSASTCRITSLMPAVVPSSAADSAQWQVKSSSLGQQFTLLWVIWKYDPNVRVGTIAKKFKTWLFSFTYSTHS